MSRGTRLLLIALGVILFLAISAGLARYLTVENRERDAEWTVLKAEAAGDASGVIARLHGCAQSASCRATQQSNAARLRRPGEVKILQVKSPTAYTLTGARGRSRVAWTVRGRNPVVQCVLVARTGNFVTGISVSLLGLSPPIGGTADC